MVDNNKEIKEIKETECRMVQFLVHLPIAQDEVHHRMWFFLTWVPMYPNAFVSGAELHKLSVGMESLSKISMSDLVFYQNHFLDELEKDLFLQDELDKHPEHLSSLFQSWTLVTPGCMRLSTNDDPTQERKIGKKWEKWESHMTCSVMSQYIQFFLSTFTDKNTENVIQGLRDCVSSPKGSHQWELWFQLFRLTLKQGDVTSRDYFFRTFQGYSSTFGPWSSTPSMTNIVHPINSINSINSINTINSINSISPLTHENPVGSINPFQPSITLLERVFQGVPVKTKEVPTLYVEKWVLLYEYFLNAYYFRPCVSPRIHSLQDRKEFSLQENHQKQQNEEWVDPQECLSSFYLPVLTLLQQAIISIPLHYHSSIQLDSWYYLDTMENGWTTPETSTTEEPLTPKDEKKRYIVDLAKFGRPVLLQNPKFFDRRFMSQLNPHLAINRDGVMLMNIRYSNYDVNTYQSLEKEHRIRTKNLFFWNGKPWDDFHIPHFASSYFWMDPTYHRDPHPIVEGLEDVKFFWYRDRWCFIGNCCDYYKHVQKPCVVMGCMQQVPDIHTMSWKTEECFRVRLSPHEKECEKNWMPMISPDGRRLMIVYSISPFVVYEFFWETKEAHFIYQSPPLQDDHLFHASYRGSGIWERIPDSSSFYRYKEDYKEDYKEGYKEDHQDSAVVSGKVSGREVGDGDKGDKGYKGDKGNKGDNEEVVKYSVLTHEVLFDHHRKRRYYHRRWEVEWDFQRNSILVGSLRCTDRFLLDTTAARVQYTLGFTFSFPPLLSTLREDPTPQTPSFHPFQTCRFYMPFCVMDDTPKLYYSTLSEDSDKGSTECSHYVQQCLEKMGGKAQHTMFQTHFFVPRIKMNSFMRFPRIFWINCQGDTQREICFRTQMKKHHIYRHHRIRAVDCQDLLVNDPFSFSKNNKKEESLTRRNTWPLSEYHRPPKCHEKNNLKTKALVCSHIKAIKAFYENFPHEPYAIVMEDDIDLEGIGWWPFPSFHHFLDQSGLVHYAPKSTINSEKEVLWGVVNLTKLLPRSCYDHPVGGRPRITLEPVKYYSTTLAYLISREGARALLQWFFSYPLPSIDVSDVDMYREFPPLKNYMTSLPLFFSHSKLQSTLHPSQDAYQQKCQKDVQSLCAF